MFIKQSTAYTFRLGPFLDETDGKTAETGLTISQADVRLSKGGGNFAQKNESSSSSHDEIGYYICVLDTTDTNTCGELLVAVHESGALPVFKTFQVVEEAIYAALFAASATGELLVDVAKISGDATAANNLELMYDGTGYGGGSTKLAVNATQIEGSDATDQINAACDAAIVTYNLDHLMHTAVASNADMTTEVPDGTVLSNIMTKTGDTSDYAYATDSLESLGEGVNVLTVEGTDATDAVQTSAGAALIAYNLDHLMKTPVASNADMTTEIPDGTVLSNLMTKTGDTSDYAYATDSLEGLANSGTTALTESYASDGAAATPAQLLYMIYCTVGEFSITDTTITGKKVDGSTTAMTWTINSASSPTSRTRAS